MDKITWAAEEMKNLPVHDKRIIERASYTLEQISKTPEASIPKAFQQWSQTQGMYRLLSHPQINPQVLQLPHNRQTRERMAQQGGPILIVQDTTTLTYQHPATKGLGEYTTTQGCLGILCHSAIAISTSGVPLGILGMDMWTRAPGTRGKKQERRQKAIQEKESYKWLKSMEVSSQWVPAGVKAVTVCDRESDIFEFLHFASQKGQDVLIRAIQERRVLDEQVGLKEAMNKQEIAGYITIHLPRDAHAKQVSREATLAIKYRKVTLLPPTESKKALPPIEMYSIQAEEVTAPPTEKQPIRWLLLTSLAINNLEEAVEKLEWYKKRWVIERFHYVLKSGFTIENLQLQTVERLKNAIALYAIAAWKVLWLRYEAEENPDEPCTVILQEKEWRTLYCVSNKTKNIPDTPLTLSEAAIMIAKLGGFLARKCDGKPGVKSIWRGLARLTDMVTAFEIFSC